LADEIYARIATLHPERQGFFYAPATMSAALVTYRNNVAHTAKPEEVKAAVLTKQLDSKERLLLEQLYTFTYKLSV